MRIIQEASHLGGAVVVLRPEVFRDDRGFFMESYRRDQFQALALPTEFDQDSHSRSRRGVLRGLHFQWDPPMGKLMRVTVGAAFLVAVDIRPDSPTLGQWFGLETSADSALQVWAPAGFARGFCAVSEWAEVQYKCTASYNSQAESGIRWNDPALGIDWPLKDPIVSAKDAQAQSLQAWLRRPEAAHFCIHQDK